MDQVARTSKPRKCPNCGSHKIARILYGLIDDLSPELEKDLKEGTVTLGGCVVGKEKWECVGCGDRF